MKLKCTKHWLPNGDIVLVVKDHDAPIVKPRLVSGQDLWGAPFWDKPVHIPTLERLVLPRGTPRKEVENAKKALLLTCELKLSPL